MVSVSIIIPSYNSAEYISDCLTSLSNQTYKNFEVLVIDGLSKDNTVQIAEGFSDRLPSIRVHSEADKGVYDAMNKGIKMAKGDYYLFLGSDDQLYNNDVLHDFFADKFEPYDIIYGNVLFKHRNVVYSGESSASRLVEDQISICHQAIFYAKNVFEIMGLYNLKYHIHSDYDFNVRCFENESLTKKYIDKITVLYNEEGLSFSSCNADGYLEDMAQHCLDNYTTPLQMYFKNVALKHELNYYRQNGGEVQVSGDTVKNTTEYILGTKMVKVIRSVNRFLPFNIKNIV